jgi:hypothetical protein
VPHSHYIIRVSKLDAFSYLPYVLSIVDTSVIDVINPYAVHYLTALPKGCDFKVKI